MISKSYENRPFDWDQHLSFLLFSYRVLAQESTKDLPFFLLHGLYARVPTKVVLSFQRSPYITYYNEDVMDNLSSAQKHIATAQSNLKCYYGWLCHADENKVQKED